MLLIKQILTVTDANLTNMNRAVKFLFKALSDQAEKQGVRYPV